MKLVRLHVGRDLAHGPGDRCYYPKWILGTTVAVTDSADLEKRFAALDAALAKGISDASAGRV
ncbi:hypothetical protein X754_14065 [Mesorhizobium sp. LNJC403B00]|nr:hypothetical protein X754_14065 [Mesorhizobium sp. LNJC403B00]